MLSYFNLRHAGRTSKKLLGAVAVLLSISILTYGQGNTFKKIRYQGGSVASKVKPDEIGRAHV